MYRVIEYFTDLQDDDHEYRTGDIFPREGLKVSEARLAELASAENLRGIPLIELVEQTLTISVILSAYLWKSFQRMEYL